MISGVQEIYQVLYRAYGPQHWWPARTPFEVVVGAFLTQHCAWPNVERAIAALRQAGALDPVALRQLGPAELEQLIRPAGCSRQKAARLQEFARHLLANYAGRLAALLDAPTEVARNRLLALPGIGPETADAILLYAGGHPSFVIDAYTCRIFARLGLLRSDVGYAEARSFFHRELPADVQLFNEYHALLVAHGKECCRKCAPRCPHCPLLELCQTGRALVPA